MLRNDEEFEKVDRDCISNGMMLQHRKWFHS